MNLPNGIDRLSIRTRPGPLPLMYQSWRKLLFIHWQLPSELLRRHLPERLELDTYDGQAWIGVTPFIIRNLRPFFAPPLPWLSNFNELNVRTYVHYKGVPGVWFFSLDVDSLPAVIGARLGFRLPYYSAKMSFKEQGNQIHYSSSRSVSSAHPPTFEAAWQKGALLGQADLHSLEFFLVERYCLYTAQGSNLYRARIFHKPWTLQTAELTRFHSTMIEAQGLPTPCETPLLHYSEQQDVAVWPLKKLV